MSSSDETNPLEGAASQETDLTLADVNEESNSPAATNINLSASDAVTGTESPVKKSKPRPRRGSTAERKILVLDEAAIRRSELDEAEGNNGGTVEEMKEATRIDTASTMTHDTDIEDDAEFAKLLFRDETFREEDFLPFRFRIFMFEFWTSWLFPLSLPVILAVQGVTAAQNKWFFPKPGRLNWFMINFCLSTPISWAPQVMALILWEVWPVQVVCVCATFGLFRIIVVAGKYAGYTEEEYDAVLSDTSTNTEKQLLAQKWVTVSDTTILDELAISEQTCRLKLNEMALTLRNGKKICAQRYLFTLLKLHFGTKPFDSHNIIFRLASILLFGYPIWTYLKHINFPNHTSEDIKIKHIVLVFLMCMQVFMYAPTVFNFMKIGLYHYRRHLGVATALLYAVMPSHAIPPKVDGHMFAFSEVNPEFCSVSVSRILPTSPTVPTNADEEAVVHFMGKQTEEEYDMNITAWDSMRRVTREFGRNQGHRIAFNTFATAVIIVVFVLILLQQFINGTRDWPLFAFLIMCFVILAGLAMGTLVYGYLLNRNEEFVETMLSGEEQHLVWLGNNEKKEKIRSLRHFIDLRQSTHPVAVMYLPAKPQLISAFLGVLFSGLLIVIQMTTNAVS